MAQDGTTPRFASSHLRLFCLPKSHKNDDRLVYGIIILIVATIRHERTNYIDLWAWHVFFPVFSSSLLVV